MAESGTGWKGKEGATLARRFEGEWQRVRPGSTWLGFTPLRAQTKGQRVTLLSPSSWLATPNGRLSLQIPLVGRGPEENQGRD